MEHESSGETTHQLTGDRSRALVTSSRASGSEKIVVVGIGRRAAALADKSTMACTHAYAYTRYRQQRQRASVRPRNESTVRPASTAESATEAAKGERAPRRQFPYGFASGSGAEEPCASLRYTDLIRSMYMTWVDEANSPVSGTLVGDGAMHMHGGAAANSGGRTW